MQKLNQNGTSATDIPGTFNYEIYQTRIRGKEVDRVQWDYRNENGTLHTGIAKSVEGAKVQARQCGYQEQGTI